MKNNQNSLTILFFDIDETLLIGWHSRLFTKSLAWCSLRSLDPYRVHPDIMRHIVTADLVNLKGAGCLYRSAVYPLYRTQFASFFKQLDSTGENCLIIGLTAGRMQKTGFAEFLDQVYPRESGVSWESCVDLVQAANERKAVAAAEVAHKCKDSVGKVVFLDNIKKNTDTFVSDFCKNYADCSNVHAIHMQTNAGSKDPKSTSAFKTLRNLFPLMHKSISAQAVTASMNR